MKPELLLSVDSGDVSGLIQNKAIYAGNIQYCND